MDRENQSMLRTLRKLAAALAVSAWLSAAPTNAAFENTAAANAAVECDETLDCSGEVCVEGQCVSCLQDPEQCDNYEYGAGGNLIDPFCEGASGLCWECTDCSPYGCDPDNYECNPSSSCTGYDCGLGWECNDDETCANSCWYSWTWTCQTESSCAPPCP